jgi:hypothetical protein
VKSEAPNHIGKSNELQALGLVGRSQGPTCPQRATERIPNSCKNTSELSAFDKQWGRTEAREVARRAQAASMWEERVRARAFEVPAVVVAVVLPCQSWGVPHELEPGARTISMAAFKPFAPLLVQRGRIPIACVSSSNERRPDRRQICWSRFPSY